MSCTHKTLVDAHDLLTIAVSTELCGYILVREAVPYNHECGVCYWQHAPVAFTLQDPKKAMQELPEYKNMHAEDPFLKGFEEAELRTCMDIVAENNSSMGQFSACLLAPDRDPSFAQRVSGIMSSLFVLRNHAHANALSWPLRQAAHP